MGKRHLGFKGLEEKVRDQYEAKGVPPGTAEKYGEETAGKVAQLKKMHKG